MLVGGGSQPVWVITATQKPWCTSSIVWGSLWYCDQICRCRLVHCCTGVRASFRVASQLHHGAKSKSCCVPPLRVRASRERWDRRLFSPTGIIIVNVPVSALGLEQTARFGRDRGRRCHISASTYHVVAVSLASLEVRAMSAAPFSINPRSKIRRHRFRGGEGGPKCGGEKKRW